MAKKKKKIGRREKGSKKLGRWENQDEKGEGRMSLLMSHEFLISQTSSQGSFIFYELRRGAGQKEIWLVRGSLQHL